MPDIESALAELEAALDRAAAASAETQNGRQALTAELEELRAERDRLRDEVETLRSASEEDARLRAEAADAVRNALSDLRGIVHEESKTNA
ncbi:MAG TPA: hypothetical protein VMM55_08605 [Thermohalobaculum sp.]|nr:hypothetical protein [Thermohalobaculum sp.]